MSKYLHKSPLSHICTNHSLRYIHSVNISRCTSNSDLAITSFGAMPPYMTVNVTPYSAASRWCKPSQCVPNSQSDLDPNHRAGSLVFTTSLFPICTCNQSPFPAATDRNAMHVRYHQSINTKLDKDGFFVGFFSSSVFSFPRCFVDWNRPIIKPQLQIRW